MRSGLGVLRAMVASVIVLAAIASLAPAVVLLGLAYVAWPYGEPWRAVPSDAAERRRIAKAELEEWLSKIRAAARAERQSSEATHG